MNKKILLATTLAAIPLYMGVVSAEATQGIVTAISLNVRSGPDKTYDNKFLVYKGDTLTITNSSNGWYEVTTQDGRTGWASSKYISVLNSSESKIKIVNTTNLNMRSGPSTSYSVVTVLPKGTEVEVISTEDGWSKVKYNSYTGYVSDKYLIDKETNDVPNDIPSDTPNDIPVTTTKKYVNVSSLNMRSGPSTSYSIVTILKSGAEVEVLSTEDGWSKVKYGSYTGYVSDKYLVENKVEDTPSDTPNDTPVTTTKKYVNVSSLNMRSGPSTSYSVVTILKSGAEVEVISTEDGWSKVKYGSYTGYVSDKYLVAEMPNNSQPTTTKKYVNTSSLNVRSGPSTSSTVLTRFSYGKEVEVVSVESGWAKIVYNGGYAYVSDQYLSTSSSGGSSTGGTTSGTTTVDGKLTYINTYEILNYSIDDMIRYQKSVGFVNQVGTNTSGYVNATDAQIRTYLSPSTFPTNATGKLQFLRLDKYTPGISAAELNSYFAKYCKSHSVFLNKGQAFVNAAQKYNIDLSYLVCASMLETGYGTSRLAQGVYVNGVKVYNFFGVGAYSGSSASNYAYKQGWTSVDKTIDGSAKWLSENYIHSSKYHQNTLYKLRWQYKSGYQYASDITWPQYVGKMMHQLSSSYYESGTFEYLIPKYK